MSKTQFCSTSMARSQHTWSRYRGRLRTENSHRSRWERPNKMAQKGGGRAEGNNSPAIQERIDNEKGEGKEKPQRPLSEMKQFPLSPMGIRSTQIGVNQLYTFTMRIRSDSEKSIRKGSRTILKADYRSKGIGGVPSPILKGRQESPEGDRENHRGDDDSDDTKSMTIAMARLSRYERGRELSSWRRRYRWRIIVVATTRGAIEIIVVTISWRRW